MIHKVCAPNAVFSVISELSDQSDEALIDIKLSIKLDSGNIEVPMGSRAEIIIVNNVKLDIIVKESALYWPDIEEDVDSEVAKEEGQVLATSNVSMESLACD